MQNDTGFKGFISERAAVREAERCLDCIDAPCTRGCPAQVDIPRFISRIAQRNFKGAAHVLRDGNVLAEICAFSCSQGEQCEAECCSSKLAHPVRIGALQHFIAALDRKERLYRPERRTLQNGPASIAVAGAGPSGISCAHYLYRLGYGVEIFEKESAPGGIPLTLIPSCRLDPRMAEEEIRNAVDFPEIQLHCGKPLSADITPQSLLDRGFSAVFIGIGLSSPKLLPMDRPEGVTDGIRFLKQCKNDPDYTVRGTVVVTGGGNAALDCAVSAVKRGADDVYMLYRRGFVEMPCWWSQKSEALFSGVHVLILTEPARYIPDSRGKLRAVECRRTALGEKDTSGRRAPEPIPDSEFELEADIAIEAVGQVPSPETEQFLQEIEHDSRNLIAVSSTLAAGMKGVFAGGDIVNGGASVVQAVADGRNAAEQIDRICSMK